MLNPLYKLSVENHRLKTQAKNMQAIIDELSFALNREKEKNALLDSTPLPKCRSLACAKCEHIVYTEVEGRVFILGCGINNSCKDFMRVQQTGNDITNRLTESLRSQG